MRAEDSRALEATIMDTVMSARPDPVPVCALPVGDDAGAAAVSALVHQGLLHHLGDGTVALTRAASHYADLLDVLP